MQGSDDVSYNLAAHRLATGTYDARTAPPIHGKRFALLVPLAFLQRAFGAGEITGCLPSIAASFAILVLVVVVARGFSERAAWIAGALWACLPINVLYSTTAFPDILQAALATGAFVLVRERITPARAAGAGILIGVAWMAKETAVYWGAATLAFLIWRKQPFRWIALYCAAAALVPAAETIAYGVTVGDPLFRLHGIHAEYYVDLTTKFYPTTASIVRRLMIELPFMLATLPHFGLVPLLAAGAVLVLRKDKSAAPWIFLLVALLLCYNFWPARIWPFLPNTILHRYLVPLFVPAAILVGVAADRVWARWTPAALAALALAWVPILWVTRYNLRQPFEGVRATLAVLKEEKAAIHTDWRTADTLAYLSGYRLNTRIVGNAEPALRSGDVIVWNLPWRDLWEAPLAYWRDVRLPEPWIVARIPVPGRRRFGIGTPGAGGEIVIYRVP